MKKNKLPDIIGNIEFYKIKYPIKSRMIDFLGNKMIVKARFIKGRAAKNGNPPEPNCVEDIVSIHLYHEFFGGGEARIPLSREMIDLVSTQPDFEDACQRYIP